MEDQKKRLTSQEIEALCVKVLRSQIGLKQITYAEIRPYKDAKTSWTWELHKAGPGATKKTLKEANREIAKLRGEYDLIP
jgi:hypothetical protein